MRDSRSPSVAVESEYAARFAGKRRSSQSGKDVAYIRWATILFCAAFWVALYFIVSVAWGQ